jgi:hypothetical protein
MKSPILGQAYVARSINAANNRMVNLFPEATPEAGKEIGFLNRAPGLRRLATIGTGPIRGMWSNQQASFDAFVVSGTEVYRVNANYVATKIGNVTGTGPVSIAYNGIQVFFACNGPSYIYNTASNTFGQITDPDFPGAKTVSYLDGYFVFNEPNTQRIWVTSLLDGTAIDPLEFASAEGSPDNVTGIIADHRELWVFGNDSVEVWYNSGALDFPLTRIQGAYNEIGCLSAFSIAKLDNALFWLGQDARGYGIVYRANGYTGVRMSTHAVEYAIQQYGDVSDAIGYTYQQEGHAFYVLTFPKANATWVFDVATGAWHERAGFENGVFVRHRSNCQMTFNSETVVGDYQNGNIYAFDLEVFADNGQPQKWLRSWRALPTGANNLKRTAQHSLQLDAETGVGLNGIDPLDPLEYNLATTSGDDIVTNEGDFIAISVETVEGANPEVMLRWSDDGGHTWSNEHWRSMGRIGTYGTRTIWRRLGMTIKLRDRVYEVSGTDPVKIDIMGAELILDPTNA